jgi:light-regulated signal transduction histidine kinase (bacteriophytochrome)
VEERTAQLEAENKELEASSYSVSHDLRAPLRHVDGISKTLLVRQAENLDDAGRDYLLRIRGAVQRMNQLIEDLLELSCIARTEVNKTAVNLTGMAKEITSDPQEEGIERQVEFVLEDGWRQTATLDYCAWSWKTCFPMPGNRPRAKRRPGSRLAANTKTRNRSPITCRIMAPVSI